IQYTQWTTLTKLIRNAGRFWDISNGRKSNFEDFTEKTYEHSVFIDIIRRISFQHGEMGVSDHESNAISQIDEKNSSGVNAFRRNRDNTDILKKRKLWQIESSDLDYIRMRDQQLEKQVKLIRDNTIKVQYSEQTQSRFFETNASVMNISSILNDTEKSHSTIVPNDDSYKTPPPRPREITLTTPQKLTFCDQTMQYLVRHFSVNVNKQCVIMKADKVDTFPKEIRNWLVDVLLSEKDAFENAIMSTPNPDHPFREVCRNILFDFFSMTIKGPFNRYIGERKYTVDRIVPLFKAIQSNTLHKVDGIGFKVSSNKEIIFFEVSGGPENPILKHVREDTEKLIKEGDRITLSELCLDKRHYYKISQIKSAMMPISFEEVEKFIEVFELLYALDGLKKSIKLIKKIMLSDSISNGSKYKFNLGKYRNNI
ncbi:13377_t:CDS:10, partial [Ambispora leptoticha]